MRSTGRRELATCDPEYYGHEQALFLDLYEAGLVYRKESDGQLGPGRPTVLANEQVIDGKGWRSGAQVEKRKLSQWFLKITHFADELLDGLRYAGGLARKGPVDAGELDRQIARACDSLSDLSDGRDGSRCYSTRPDTIFGASFVAIAADHPIAQGVAADNPAAAEFIEAMQARRDHRGRTGNGREAGLRHRDYGARIRSIRRAACRSIIANFVLMDYGTGAVMGVPAHDQRDLEFARKYKLPVTRVVANRWRG